MTISVIQMAFLSFSSSQISGGNVVFLDFIPVILTSFHHSGVIQKVSLNRNDVGMTENFGPNSTTFPIYIKPSMKVRYLTYHISGEAYDVDNPLAHVDNDKDKYKYKDNDKILKRPNMCYVF